MSAATRAETARLMDMADVPAIAERMREERDRLRLLVPQTSDLQLQGRIEEDVYELNEAIKALSIAPERVDRIYVIGGTSQQAVLFARNYDFRAHARIVGSPETLRGRTLRDAVVLRVGTWYERRDLKQLEEHLAWAGATSR